MELTVPVVFFIIDGARERRTLGRGEKDEQRTRESFLVSESDNDGRKAYCTVVLQARLLWESENGRKMGIDGLRLQAGRGGWDFRQWLCVCL